MSIQRVVPQVQVGGQFWSIAVGEVPPEGLPGLPGLGLLDPQLHILDRC
ncbi:MAG: hypothetical protein ACR2HX_13435 [Pyrinomonadaceae bacterium]